MSPIKKKQVICSYKEKRINPTVPFDNTKVKLVAVVPKIPVDVFTKSQKADNFEVSIPLCIKNTESTYKLTDLLQNFLMLLICKFNSFGETPY